MDGMRHLLRVALLSSLLLLTLAACATPAPPRPTAAPPPAVDSAADDLSGILPLPEAAQASYRSFVAAYRQQEDVHSVQTFPAHQPTDLAPLLIPTPLPDEVWCVPTRINGQDFPVLMQRRGGTWTPFYTTPYQFAQGGCAYPDER